MIPCYLVYFSISMFFYRGHEDIAVLLVGRGADLNHKYPSGDIPLHMAVFKDMKILVQSMIEHGVDVNAKVRLDGFFVPFLFSSFVSFLFIFFIFVVVACFFVLLFRLLDR